MTSQGFSQVRNLATTCQRLFKRNGYIWHDAGRTRFSHNMRWGGGGGWGWGNIIIIHLNLLLTIKWSLWNSVDPSFLPSTPCYTLWLWYEIKTYKKIVGRETWAVVEGDQVSFLSPLCLGGGIERRVSNIIVSNTRPLSDIKLCEDR